MTKALEGVRVLDMTHVQSGPSATQLLAWLGADVIKLEAPSGDITRTQLRDLPDADSLYFTMLNCNKRSITLNTKTERGKELLTTLITRSDILVENFGPGAIDRMGFTWDHIHTINPRLTQGAGRRLNTARRRSAELRPAPRAEPAGSGAASLRTRAALERGHRTLYATAHPNPLREPGMSTAEMSPASATDEVEAAPPTSIGRLVEANARYAAAFEDPGMDARPVREVAVVACMDARIDLHAALGLALGDCHTIRNAGGVVTDDTIRSLTISQRALGTRSVVLVHHTGCGLQGLTDDFRHELEREVGQRPSWAVEGFKDVDQDVRQSLQKVRTSPFLLHVDDVRGFVFDVRTGWLREVTAGA